MGLENNALFVSAWFMSWLILSQSCEISWVFTLAIEDFENHSQMSKYPPKIYREWNNRKGSESKFPYIN